MGKKKNGPNLGRSIIRDRFAKTTGIGGGGSFLHTAELNDGYDWGRLNLQSVTEQNNLEDFLATAELAGTEFTAEKLNVTFVSRDTYTGIPKGEELSKIKGLHKEHESLLRIPRKPRWTKEMSASEVDHNEKMAFLDWRRSLATLQDVEGLVMTPYEKNLDFWRQLWRVIERSDVVVQIVDARNPLMFYCPDLVTYVREVDPTKQCVVLINKADYLTLPQREAWADYFSKVGIRCMFWSALEEAERLAAEESAISDTEETSELTDNSDEDDDEEEEEEEEEEDKMKLQECGETDDLKRATDLARSEGNTDVNQVSEELENFKLEKQSTDSENLMNSGHVIHGSADSEPQGITSDSSSQCTCTAESSVKETDKDNSGTGHTAASGGGERSMTERDSHCDAETGAFAGAGGGGGGSESVHNTACVYTGQELLDILRGLHTRSVDAEQLITVGMVGYPNVGKSSTVNAILKMKKVPVSATPGRTKHFQTLFLDKTLMLCDCPGLVFPSFVTTKADLLVNGVLSIDQMRDHTPPITLICERLPRHILEKTYGINIPLPGEGDDPDRPPTAIEMMNAYSAMRGFMTSSGIPDCPRGARIVLKDYVNGKLLFCQPPTGVDPTNFNVYPEPEAPRASKGGSTEEGKPVSSGPPVSKIDRDFFNKDKSRVHTRTAQQGNADTGPGGAGMMEKSWKKHNNRKKKEKLRRVYAHLDKTDY